MAKTMSQAESQIIGLFEAARKEMKKMEGYGKEELIRQNLRIVLNLKLRVKEIMDDLAKTFGAK